VDLKKIFAAAAENNVVLEINAQPDRMDLKDVYVREAKEMGAKFVINTDAHTTTSLNFMQFGIAIARRGWLEKEDVVNAYPLKQLPKFFRRLKL
jgi:DNA polymerase (family 10)